MRYHLPKKIQLQSSHVKWTLQTEDSVLLIVGLEDLKQLSEWQNSALAEHIDQLCKRAQALEIPTIFLNQSVLNVGMMQLGQYMAASEVQLIIAGHISSLMKQVIQHTSSIIEKVCVVDDAVLANNLEQHIQWVDAQTTQNIHHMNSSSITRLWSLTAPKEMILSSKGVLLALAEHLDLAPLDIHPETDLREYGLDSVAMVTLIGLWRANGAEITYENFLKNNSLVKLFKFLNIS